MFRKRAPKVIPEGILIPKKARVLLILQLCLAFTLFAWYGSLPFMGELFTQRSKGLLFQYVMGVPPKHFSESAPNLYQRNRDRFLQLPLTQQQEILQKFSYFQEIHQTSFLNKLKSSIKILFFLIPPFLMAWLVFSVALSILTLKRFEGASQALWLLPIITICYGFQQGCTPTPISAEETLFPSEAYLVKNYLPAPLSQDILLQKEQLAEAWKLYLIREWVGSIPSMHPLTVQKQAEEGEYLFNLARLEKMELLTDARSFLYKKEPFILLFLYFLWNCYIAYSVNRELKKEVLQPARIQMA